ncbi:MAG: hypothetical protein ACK5MW_04385 [Enterococcus sp.]
MKRNEVHRQKKSFVPRILIGSVALLSAVGIWGYRGLINYQPTTPAPSSEVNRISEVTTPSATDEVTKENQYLTTTYYDQTGTCAQLIALTNNEWQLSYQTLEGEVSGTFTPEWQTDEELAVSASTFTKSDSYEFTITIKEDFEHPLDEQTPLITIEVSDGDPTHQLFLTNEEVGNAYPEILTGDLRAFAGSYSSDAYEQAIKDSEFTLGGYQPADYYTNNTTNFNSLTADGQYWEGAMHAAYSLDPEQLPQEIAGCYEVYLVGSNAVAIPGQKSSILLVPENIKAPDGTTSDEKRIFSGVEYQFSLRPYHDHWWEDR